MWVISIHVRNQGGIGEVMGAGGSVLDFIVYSAHKVVTGCVAVKPLVHGLQVE